MVHILALLPQRDSQSQQLCCFVSSCKFQSFAALSGQIADGLATPTVGYLSDKFNSPIGKRTPWYILGTLLVLPTFFGTFSKCLFCAWQHPEITDPKDYNDVCPGMLRFYYILFPSLFNIGNP